MKKALLSLIAVTCSQVSIAQQSDMANDPVQLKMLFEKMSGDWHCQGEFANGKPIVSLIKAHTQRNGTVLDYSHIDHAPNNYKAMGRWSYSHDLKKVVVTHHVSLGKSANVSLYLAENWSEDQIQINAKELLNPLWAENRFTYTFSDNDKMNMLWEVNRKGEWKMGDYLNCKKLVD